MEPRIYVQHCHNGKVRVYKGKLPPAENGPYEELNAQVVVQQTSSAPKKMVSWFWIVSAATVGWAAIGGLIYWGLQ